MNTKYILQGGLAAGVLINVAEVVLNSGIPMEEYQAILEAHDLIDGGRPDDSGAGGRSWRHRLI